MNDGSVGNGKCLPRAVGQGFSTCRALGPFYKAPGSGEVRLIQCINRRSNPLNTGLQVFHAGGK